MNKPTEKKGQFGTISSHPSFAIASFSRTTGGKGNVFGSSIQHSHIIRLSIRRAERIRSELHYDTYHGREELIEVEMSPSQFAELITSLNCGEGTPVTLRYVGGERIEDCPEITDKKKEFSNEFKLKCKELGESLNSLVKKAEELKAKPSVTKADREEFLKIAASIKQEVSSNLPFTMDMFNEQTEKSIVEAKREIEAFINDKIASTGLEALKKEKLLQ
jgi:hypothetical protein